LAKTQVGDIAIKITHNSFVFRVQVWVRMQDGPSGWQTFKQFQQ